MSLGRAIFELVTDTSKFDKGIAGAKGKIGGLGTIAAGVAGGSLGGLTMAMGELGRAAAAEEANIARLSQALANVGVDYSELGGSIEKKIAAQTKSFAFSDDAQRDSLARLVVVTKDTAHAFRLQALAMDLARARGLDLVTATDAVIKVSQGRYKILQQMGIVIDETMTKEQALAALEKQVAGQAEAYGKTAQANIDRTRIAIDNAREAIGGAVGVFASFATINAGFGKGIIAAGAGLGMFAKNLFSTTKGVQLFGTALRMNPIGLIITGVAALGVGLKILYDRFEGVRNVLNGIRDAARQFLPGFAFISDLAGDTAKSLGIMGDEAAETGDDLTELGKKGAAAIFTITKAIEDSEAKRGGAAVAETEEFLKRYGADDATITAVKEALLNVTGLTKDQRFKEALDQDYAAVESAIRKSILDPMEKTMADVRKMSEQEFAALAREAGRTPKQHMDALQRDMEATERRFEHAMKNIQVAADNALKSTDLDKRTSGAMDAHRSRIHTVRDAWNEARDAVDAYSIRANMGLAGILPTERTGGGGGGHLIAAYHSGGVVARTGPAALLAGETVLPRGVAPVTVAPAITLNYSGDGGAGIASRLAQDVVDITTETLRQQVRRLGMVV